MITFYNFKDIYAGRVSSTQMSECSAENVIEEKNFCAECLPGKFVDQEKTQCNG